MGSHCGDPGGGGIFLPDLDLSAVGRELPIERSVVVVVPVMLIVVTVIVAISIPVPAMIVFDTTPAAFPIACEEPLTIVTGPYPYRAWKRWPTPIALVPLVMVSDWIPVALYPNPLRAGTGRRDSNHPWGWWRADSDTDGDVCCQGRSTGN
jgi:hypothetical protein